MKMARGTAKYGKTGRRITLEKVNKSLSEILFYSVSNVEPYQHLFKRGRWIEEPTIGGLATSVDSVMRETGGTWVVWGRGGKVEKEYTEEYEIPGRKNTVIVPKDDPKYALKRVYLSKEEISKYYHGLCNRTLWPGSHEVDVPPVFHRDDYWESYVKVNRKFADNIPNEGKSLIMIHDYHLALVPKILKERNPESVNIFFWHIPWPSTDRYRRSPWESEILEGLISSDLIGFHLDNYVENFLKSVDICMAERGREDIKVNHDNGTITHGKDLTTIVRSYPLGIDFKKFENMAKNPVINPDELYTGKILVFGAARLDYTKGISEKFRAIERFFEKYWDNYKGNIVFVQIASPSREKVKRYRDTKKEIIRLADRVNNRFSIGGWKPIELIIKSYSQDMLAALERRADVNLILPHHDGMNLIAKEGVASQVENKAVLILSKFAGAAKELGEYSLLVNPFDKNQVAEAIHQAVTMPRAEREGRMKAMRKQVKKNDLNYWVRGIMGDAISLYNKRG